MLLVNSVTCNGESYLLFVTVQWSFGVTCWEVFTGGKQSYPGIHPLQVPELLESGQRMTVPDNATCTKEM